jgi:hypothetical protein
VRGKSWKVSGWVLTDELELNVLVNELQSRFTAGVPRVGEEQFVGPSERGPSSHFREAASGMILPASPSASCIGAIVRPTGASAGPRTGTGARAHARPLGSSSCACAAGRSGMPGVEGGDQLRDLGCVRGQREVAGIEQVKLGARNIRQVGTGAVGDEELVVGAPGDQRRRLVLTQVGVPARVQREVARLVVDQVEHHP